MRSYIHIHANTERAHSETPTPTRTENKSDRLATINSCFVKIKSAIAYTYAKIMEKGNDEQQYYRPSFNKKKQKKYERNKINEPI